MNHILFIGYSNLLRKRILPIIDKIPFTKISVAKHELQNWETDDISFIKYDNYEDAFNQCTPDIIYISTINSAHYELALKALNNGVHVIVDKPSTLCFDETVQLVERAKQKKLLMCESTVYLNHPQFQVIKDLLKERNYTAKHVTVHFSFPPLNSNNFRYKKKAGGGAIYDTGPYVASIGRYFFNEVPLHVSIDIHESNDEVETSYSALLKYSNGKSVMAYCGFNTEYINRINILGNNFLIDVNRVFTIPDDVENSIICCSNNKTETLFAKKGNTFQLFFAEVLESLKSNNFNCFYNKMLVDSETIQKLIANKS
jgi:dTDP-3,4-didehydro-2,6-dideoxy-alpha-D-glucose 3-reductase